MEVLFFHNNLRLQPLFIDRGAIDTFEKLLPSLPKQKFSKAVTQFLAAAYFTVVTASIVPKLSTTM